MPIMTAGTAAIESALPKEYRGKLGILDTDGIKALFADIGKNHPDQYRDISHRLNQMGALFAYRTGGASFGPEQLRTPAVARQIKQKIADEIERIMEDPQIDEDSKPKEVIDAVERYREKFGNSIMDTATKERNPLMKQVKSGTRGSRANIMSLLGSDLLYADANNNTIPIPILRSFSEGLSPAEFLASSYGTRQGVLGAKLATQKGGYFEKLLVQVAHRQRVTDDDDDGEPDVNEMRGLPVDTDDPDNEGALLARDIGDFKRNAVITPAMMVALKRAGINNILVRSPISGRSRHGGVNAKDVGIREFGRLPRIGESVGVVSGQAVGERVAQGALGSKHGGGVAGGSNSVSGFDAFNNQIQIPKVFPGGATHAETDGRVEKIEKAPGGGHMVIVDGVQHFVPEEMGITAKIGDYVEAGDTMSEGWPNPAKIVEHKGIGEGKRQFIQSFKKALRSGGIKPQRRNLELIAQGLINHVEMTDDQEAYTPGDVMTYDFVERNYQPREDSRMVDVDHSRNQYLEKPILHYSIGTKVRPSVINTLKQYGVTQVNVHEKPPGFRPKMIRASDNLNYDPDWMVRMYGSNLKKTLLDSARRGLSSDPFSTSFVPGVATGMNFGGSKLFRPPEYPESLNTQEKDERQENVSTSQEADVPPPPAQTRKSLFSWKSASTAFQPNFTASARKPYSEFASTGYRTSSQPTAANVQPTAFQGGEINGEATGRYSGVDQQAAEAYGQFGQPDGPVLSSLQPSAPYKLITNPATQLLLGGPSGLAYGSAGLPGLGFAAGKWTANKIAPTAMKTLGNYGRLAGRSLLGRPTMRQIGRIMRTPGVGGGLQAAPTTMLRNNMAAYGAYAAAKAPYDLYQIAKGNTTVDQFNEANRATNMGAYGTMLGALESPGTAMVGIGDALFGRDLDRTEPLSRIWMRDDQLEASKAKMLAEESAARQQEMQGIRSRIASGQATADDLATARYWEEMGKRKQSTQDQLAGQERSAIYHAYAQPVVDAGSMVGRAASNLGHGAWNAGAGLMNALRSMVSRG